jgi:mRNA export factor
VVARHDAPIRHLFSLKDMSNMLVTGGWDKTLRYWDLRQPNPVHVQQLPERVYAMDVRYPLAVLGLANRRIQARLLHCCL